MKTNPPRSIFQELTDQTCEFHRRMNTKHNMKSSHRRKTHRLNANSKDISISLKETCKLSSPIRDNENQSTKISFKPRLRSGTSANQILFLFVIALLTHQSECIYDLCYNITSGDALACEPSSYDVILGPNVQVTIEPPTATCGNPPSTWTQLGVRGISTVFTCNANDPNLRHPPEYMIDSDLNTVTWWQSVNQAPQTDTLEVTVVLSFKKLFRLSGDIIIIFNSGRPQEMVIERSTDNGVTWQAWQYYARDCSKFAAQTGGATITKDNPTAVVCSSAYWETNIRRIQPGGQVEMLVQEDRFDIFKGPFPNMYKDLYVAIDTQMLQFLQFTDIRFRLLAPATDGRNTAGLSTDPAAYNMYHYAISKVLVVGRCYCNLHANYCNYTNTDVICDCQHNTQGVNCEACLPLYNDRPWQRGSFLEYPEGTANECQKCECNDHALSCTYNSTYGRGICDVCLHNTRGFHCELCIEGFYANVSAPLNAIDRCLDCDCELLGVTDPALPCDQSLTPGILPGQCPCKQGLTGRRCDECLPGFFGLFLNPVGSCEACGCDLDGTVGQSNACAQDDGQCPCKPSTTGRTCDQCADGFFSFPRGNPQRGCFPCNCDEGGSVSLVCDKTSGVCQCRPGVGGDKCDQTQAGEYIPAIDLLSLEPQDPQPNGPCTVTSDLWTAAAPFDGTGFAVCPVSATDIPLSFQTLTGAMMQLALEWPYHMAVRYTSVTPDITGTLVVQVIGSSQGDFTALSTRLGQTVQPGCPTPPGQLAQIALSGFPAGTSTAVVVTDSSVPLDARCQYSISLNLRKPGALPAGGRRKRALSPSDSEIFIDSLVMFPALTNQDGSVDYTIYNSSADINATVDTYGSCIQRVADLKSRGSAFIDNQCKAIFFAMGSELYNGAQACDCDDIGSLSTVCQSLGGQCLCKVGVAGRACDVCLPGYYNFTDTGCSACNCYPSGSENGACGEDGQCPCLTNVALLTTSVPGDDGEAPMTPFDGTCSQCFPNFYGISTGLGCSACNCNEDGSQQLQCDELGQCLCKDSVMGEKCDACKEAYYGFGPEGCSACNCSEAGSESLDCDLNTGLCTCKTNVQGDKCDDCKVNFFNLEEDNPKGCQPCFCYNHGTDCTSAPGFVDTLIEINNPDDENLQILYGDQHISYGRTLTLTLTAQYILDIYNEVMITLENNNKKLQHVAPNDTIINRDFGLDYSVRLWEENWFYVDDTLTQPATAANVYEILANIDEVRPVTRAYGQVVNVNYLSLESAILANSTDDMTETNVTFVEECTCLPEANVGGLSCEMCATGNKRADPETATSYDTCVACDCNGRGATDPPECNELTGICLNCRNGTTGDQCELCSANVTGPECDQCETEFWGLDMNGCKECACSFPGSVDNFCDQIDGQCSCLAHVVGRQCDQCEENFYNLTETGCQACDSCYDEVAKAIVPLRSLRDDISSNLSLAQRQDMTSVNGPFVERLNMATTDSEKLVNFLTSALESEAQVLSQISSLNASLSDILDRLSLIEENTTNEIETLLLETQNALTEVQSKRASMETFTKNAFANLALVQPLSSDLSALVSSLREVEQYLQSQADASSSDLRLIDDLSTLNDTTARANALANQASEKSAALLAVHQNTTARLLELEGTIITGTNRVIEILSRGEVLTTSMEAVQSQVVSLQSQLNELEGYSVDTGPLKARTEAAARATSSYKSQLAASLNLFSPTNMNALKSEETTELLANQTQELTDNASDWLMRSTAAEQKTLTIQSQADAVFGAAGKALNTVTNFASLSEFAKSQAADSLAQVTNIQTTATELIQQSEQLRSSIANLQQLASSAKVASEQALNSILEKQQQLHGVLVQAEQLEVRLNNEVDLSNERYARVSNLQNNIVDPATNQLSTISVALDRYNTLYATTDSTTTESLTQTAAVRETANQLLVQLRGIQTVNTDAAQQLLAQVRDAVTNTNVENLRRVVSELQTTSNIQKAEIARLTNQKTQLAARVAQLQTVVSQLSLA